MRTRKRPMVSHSSPLLDHQIAGYWPTHEDLYEEQEAYPPAPAPCCEVVLHAPSCSVRQRWHPSTSDKLSLQPYSF